MRGPGCWRLVAGLQPTGAVQFWGHAKWLSYPGGCEHTASLNISASVTSRQPDGWEARGTLGLGPALPVLPDVRVHRRMSRLALPWPLTGGRADRPCVLMNETD